MDPHDTSRLSNENWCYSRYLSKSRDPYKQHDLSKQLVSQQYLAAWLKDQKLNEQQMRVDKGPKY